MAELFFWGSVIWIAYAYVGYSLAILLLSRLVNNAVRVADIEPHVTFLITAYNEVKTIAVKIEQTLALDYPRDKLEFIVASDGSTDGTDDVVRSYAERGVRLIRVEGRLGKTAAQNTAVEQAGGEIIVFSDATTRFDRLAIRKLVRNFADPQVGAVGGRFEYLNATGGAIGWGNILFWRYETLLKRLQSRIKTITGCSGCIYAVRKAVYAPLPADIISDLCGPLKVIEQGYRVVFEPEALATELTTERPQEEFQMRVRVVVRGMRGMLYMRTLFNPFRFGFVAFQLWSHKVTRWLIAEAAIVLLLSNLQLYAAAPFYRVTLWTQALFYALAMVPLIVRGRWPRSRLLTVPMYFVTINVAALVALWRVIGGHRAVTWETVR